MFYWIVLSGAWVIWHLAFRIKVVGKENMIHDRGFVMVCNHVFALDPVFLVLARYYGKQMVIMGKEELFEIHPLLTWFLKKVNVIPVHRGKGDTSVVERAIEDVKRGHGLLIFPEGTRSQDGTLGRLKSGAFVVADAAGVDMLPCRIIYQGGKLKLLGRVTIVIGKPIEAKRLALQGEKSAARLRECKTLVHEEMEKLLEENRNCL